MLTRAEEKHRAYAARLALIKLRLMTKLNYPFRHLETFVMNRLNSLPVVAFS